jgi:hypothetical protein
MGWFFYAHNKHQKDIHMATLAISAASTALSGALGIGAQAGWMLARTASSLLSSTPHYHGPRLEDLSTQAHSPYGQVIPWVMGTYRVQGTPLFTPPIKEHEATHQQGSKVASAHYSTYTYTADAAIGVCQGPMSAVLRIWANNELIYDCTQPTTFEKYPGIMRIYLGTETQDPPVLIEDYEGVGNVPAFKGLCYMTLTDLPLMDFGNRLPQFSIEVSQKTHTHHEPHVVPLSAYTYNNFLLSHTLPHLYNTHKNTLSAVHRTNYTVLHKHTLTLDEPYRLLTDAQPVLDRELNHVGVFARLDPQSSEPDLFPGGFAWITPHTGAIIEQFQLPFMCDRGFVAGDYLACAEKNGHRLCLVDRQTGYLKHTYTHLAPLKDGVQDREGTLWCLGQSGNQSYLYRLGATYVAEKFPLSHQSQYITYDYPSHTLCCGGTSDIYQHSCYDGHLMHIYKNKAPIGFCRTFYQAQKYTHGIFYGWHKGYIQSLNLLQQRVVNPHINNVAIAQDGSSPFFDITHQTLWTQGDRLRAVPLRRKQAESHTLGSIITQLLHKAQIPLHHIDTLNTPFYGWGICRPVTYKTLLAQIMRVYRFYGVERGNGLAIRALTHKPVCHLKETDLIWHDSHKGTLSYKRVADHELPQGVTVRYTHHTYDYDIQHTTARRHPGAHPTHVTTINDVPLLLSDTQALTLAQQNLYHQWLSRTTIRLYAMLTYVHLEPGDVIALPNGTCMRILSLDIGANNQVYMEGEQDHEAVYTMPKTLDKTSPKTSGKPILNSHDQSTQVMAFCHDSQYIIGCAGFTPRTWRGSQLYYKTDHYHAGGWYPKERQAMIGQLIDAVNIPATSSDSDNLCLTLKLPQGTKDPSALIWSTPDQQQLWIGNHKLTFTTIQSAGNNVWTLQGIQNSHTQPAAYRAHTPVLIYHPHYVMEGPLPVSVQQTTETAILVKAIPHGQTIKQGTSTYVKWVE